MPELDIKRLIQPEPIRALGLTVGIIGGVLFLAMMASGFDPLAMVGIGVFGGFFGLVALLPIGQIVRNSRGKSLAAEMAAKARRAMIAAIGREPIAIDTGGCLSKEEKGWMNASGIAWDGARLWILDSGELAAFPPEMIRRWTWRTRGSIQTRIYGGGNRVLGARIEAMVDNAESRSKAFADSGFFITVADVGRPSWQFMCEDVPTLERWEEILRQVGEGRLTA